MRNYVGRAHCPYCAKTFNFKVSKRAKTNVMLGDYILKKKSLIEDFDVTCSNCFHNISLQAVIKYGQLVAYEKGNKEVTISEYRTIPEGTYSLFSYEDRQSMLMGEDNIGFVNILSYSLAIGSFITVFGKRWRVSRVFKEVIKGTDKVNAFICEVSLETDIKQKRLLILKGGYFPMLKDVNWRKFRTTGNANTDNLLRLTRYEFSKDKEIILCLN